MKTDDAGCAEQLGRLAGKQGALLQHIALVERGKALNLPLGRIRTHPFGQNSAGKTTAVHVDQLVNQHIARGADIALKAVAPAQQHGLGVGTAIGKFRKVQHHLLDALQGTAGDQLGHVGIVRNF